MDGHGVITVSKDVSGRMVVSFLYNSQIVEKLKIIILFKNDASHSCHCEEVVTTDEAISKKRQNLTRFVRQNELLALYQSWDIRTISDITPISSVYPHLSADVNELGAMCALARS